MQSIKPYIVTIFMTLFALSCGQDMPKQLRSVPTAYGPINQLVIIMDQDMWDGPVGDTLRYYYSSAYPILPQPESIFDLRHFTPTDLNKELLRKELRNYFIVANLNDDTSETTQLVAGDLGQEKIRKAKEIPQEFNTTVGKDKWAKGQLVIYQFGNSEDELMQNLKNNFPAIKKRVNKADKEKIDASVYLDGENQSLKREVKEKFGINIRIPSDYIGAISKDNFMWMRREIPEVSSNIIISKYSYKDQSQLTREGIKAIRDSLGRTFISSELPNTYVRVNDIDLPLFVSQTNINGNFAIEARGIWEVVNDFMGGPFISYLILNAKTNELIFIDGFVYAPGKDKRNYMQYLEHIINTTK